LQEQLRYQAPDKPFVYTFNGQRCPVSPLKRAAGTSNKAREHFLLKTERPSHITLLSLVRDAASRLPGGVVTRPDVALLLKDSQHVVEDAANSQMNTVVSGALDRLHAEGDPCVKYDAEQKLWIYLHRNRGEEDFVNHHKKGKRNARQSHKSFKL